MELTSKEDLIAEMGAIASYNGNNQTPQVSISDKDWNSIKSGQLGSYEVTFTLVGVTRANSNIASVTRTYTLVENCPTTDVQPDNNTSNNTGAGTNNGNVVTGVEATSIVSLFVILVAGIGLLFTRRRK